MLFGLGENRNVRLTLLFCIDNCTQCLLSALAKEQRKVVKQLGKVKSMPVSWHF